MSLFTANLNKLDNQSDRVEFFVRSLFGKDDASLNEDLEDKSDMFSDDEELKTVELVHLHPLYYLNKENDYLFKVNFNSRLSTLKDAAEGQIINNLFSSYGSQHLSWKRDYVNYLPTDLKSSVLNKIFGDEDIEMEIRLESLEIFLDERTKFFNLILPICFFQERNYTCPIIQTILKLIPNLAPNIETIDLSVMYMSTDVLKEDLKFLLKTCTKLKSIHLIGSIENCSIFDLIFTDYNSLDRQIQIALKAIEIYILNRNFTLDENLPFFLHDENIPFSLRKLSDIFIRLPNLKSLGRNFKKLGALMNHYVKYHDTILNLIDIYDEKTNLSTLEIFAKFCPRTKTISLRDPKEKVVENLYKLPLLTEIELFYFNNNELIKYLTQNGEKINKLKLENDKPMINEQLLRQLCPNLEKYKYFIIKSSKKLSYHESLNQFT